jgi:hypothetical protein
MVLMGMRLGVNSRDVVQGRVRGLTRDDPRRRCGRLLFDIIQRITFGLHGWQEEEE